MRQSGERCGGSEAASSRGRNEAARGAAKVKRRGAPRGGERCGELAAGRTVRREANGAVQAKPRSGTEHAPLPRRPSERLILAALPPLAPAAALFPPHSPPPISPPPRLPLSLLPPPPPRPYGRGGRGKSQTRRAAFGGVAAPARPWRGAAAPLGRLASFGRAGSRKQRRGARGGKRGQNAPSFPHSGKNPPQNIAICAPVCYTMHATQFHK